MGQQDRGLWFATAGRHSVISGVAIMILAACGSGSTSAAPNDLGLIQAGTIQAITLPDSPSMSFVLQNGQETGMAIDVMNDIGRRLGLKVTYQNAPIASILPDVAAHQNDIGALFVFDTPAREQTVDFSIPWMYGTYIALAKKSSNFHSLNELAGKTIAVTLGSPQVAWVAQNLPTAKGKTFLTNAAAELALEAGQVDAFMTVSIIEAGIIQAYPDLARVGVTSPASPSAFPIAKDRPALKTAVDRELNAMYADGTWTTLYHKWAPGIPIPPDMIAQYPQLKT